MAGPVGTGPGSGRQRVFVLVDKGSARGVFTSWEAAETFADEHKLALDHLMEYVTRSDHPDHLHLMAALWDNDWEFQGEWTRQPPRWPKPPRKVRLDHYHAKGGGFQLLRQKEFPWESGLLWKVNPMAPDEALKPELPKATPAQDKPTPWKSQLTPLKPIGKEAPSAAEPGQANAEASKPKTPIPPRPDAESSPADKLKRQEDRPPPAGTEPKKSFVTEPEPSFDATAKPTAPQKPKLATGKPEQKTPSAKPPEKAKASDGDAPKPRITFQKKSPLRLKSKAAPQPIPSFETTATPTDPAGNSVSSVELAQEQHAAMVKAEEEKKKAAIKVRRVWSIRLILTVVFVMACWAGGILWVFRPEPTAASVVSGVISLNSARTKIMEPEMVFFQLPVDPVHQERWIQSLQLQPIPEGQDISIPTYHALDTWEKPSGFVRPPYSETEVNEWWELRLRKVRYGFTYTWEDGTILILDLESDTMIGWAKAKNLPPILN